jgi:hypothetical protein
MSDPSNEKKQASTSTSTSTGTIIPDHKPHHHDQAVLNTAPHQDVILNSKSPGVQRIEAISTHFTLPSRICVFFGVFLIAYAYGLDGIIRYTYQVSKTTDLLTALSHVQNPYLL